MTIVLDNPDIENMAADCIEEIPAAAPYLLHVQPELLKLDVDCPGGLVAALGITLAEAALHMVNDMRTFADAGVAVAEDGPGAGIETALKPKGKPYPRKKAAELSATFS